MARNRQKGWKINNYGINIDFLILEESIVPFILPKFP
jgi:hypothetical protein